MDANRVLSALFHNKPDDEIICLIHDTELEELNELYDYDDNMFYEFINPLTLAVSMKRHQVAVELLLRGVDMFNGRPLIEAVYNKDILMVILLLQFGADVDVQDASGLSPLMICAHGSSKEDLTIAKILIQAGAFVNLKDEDELTPLNHASSNLDITKLLIKYGANVNTTDDMGCTPLHYAETLEMVELLIKHGADVNCKAVSGLPGWNPRPLHMHMDSKDIIECLVTNRAVVDDTLCLEYASKSVIEFFKNYTQGIYQDRLHVYKWIRCSKLALTDVQVSSHINEFLPSIPFKDVFLK